MKQVPEGTILKNFFIATLILVTLATPAFASVTVSSPANGATVSSPVLWDSRHKGIAVVRAVLVLSFAGGALWYLLWRLAVHVWGLR